MLADTSSMLPEVLERDGRVVIVVPMSFKRRGNRKEIIILDGAPLTDNQQAVGARLYKPLAIAVARAHRWKDLLAGGAYATMNDLAEHLDLDRAYVRRLMNLTLLAPDLVEAILDGDEPSGLSLASLAESIPMAWEEQRRGFGASDEAKLLRTRAAFPR